MLKNKKIVMFLVNSGNYSRAEQINLKIILSLRELYKFYYVSESGVIDTYLKKNQIEHIIINKMNILALKNIEKQYHPDLFHATDYRVSVLCACANLKTPFISHLHNNPLWIKKFHPYTFAYLFAALKSEYVLTVSESIEKEYIFSKIVRKKIICISNPVCCRDILKYYVQDQEKSFDLCFTGRFADQKNPLFFLNIVKRLKKKYPKLKAVMIGDGELRSVVEKQIEKYNLSNSIVLTGFQKNPYLFMGKSKIFFMPSKYEGYGLVFFEALTLGLPCVASDVGGIPSIVTEKCGFLCKKPSDYLKGIEVLLNDNELYQKYSGEARKRALQIENHSEYMKNMEHFYRRILERKVQDG